MTFMSKRLLVLGDTGFLGKHVRQLAESEGWQTYGASLSNGFDLRSKGSLDRVAMECEPSVIVNCAAHVGGLAYGRDRQATLLSDNMQMVMESFAFLSRNPEVRMINPIANCAYPGDLTEFEEEDFWSGAIHPSVLGYGGARRFSVLASQVFRDQYNVDVVDVARPNLYGPGDHLDPVRARALGGMVFRLLSAQRDNRDEVTIWGSGNPVREWLFVDDAARALIATAALDTNSSFINIGSGAGISISELAELIASIVGFEGRLSYDTSMPDGAKEKRMLVGQGSEALSWNPHVSLREGLEITVADYRARIEGNR